MKDKSMSVHLQPESVSESDTEFLETITAFLHPKHHWLFLKYDKSY